MPSPVEPKGSGRSIDCEGPARQKIVARHPVLPQSRSQGSAVQRGPSHPPELQSGERVDSCRHFQLTVVLPQKFLRCASLLFRHLVRFAERIYQQDQLHL